MNIQSRNPGDAASIFHHGADFISEQFSSPDLRRQFKFPGHPRGVIPSQEQLPTFIGLYHTPRGFSAALKFLETLPPGARVGLEYDDLQSTNAEVQRALSLSTPSFTGLARYAESIGLKPIFVERGLFLYPEHNRNLIKRIGQGLLRLRAMTPGSNEAAELRKELATLNANRQRLRGCPSWRPIASSAWRSELMSRSIAKIGGWRSDDVVIVGTAHALNLATIFESKVDRIIGQCSSATELQTVTEDLMKSQRRNHFVLNARRKLHAVQYATLHPIQAYRNSFPSSNPTLSHGPRA